ncbi:DUF4837 family protein [Echinicola jeungdonensis]|uniref:DUF4837 family protein n=1 Tax=Echinicola jeungdonensis TaxID=709343 RepID=A0ABV5J631_9BACT|nr:DUF4837 family protein [Echinicola jeungdonensis]MDN3668068.1 DUF4837 family protein [Echinicola jeungdonensis]
MSFQKTIAWVLCILSAGLLYSCDQAQRGSNSNKPPARGGRGEIVLVIDSLKFQGEVKEALLEVFQEDIPGLVREESLYDLRRVDPRAMTRILRMAYNIVYVTTFDDKNPGSQSINAQFSKKSKEQAAKNDSLFMIRNEDEFARGQEVIYLFGNNEKELIENLRKNKSKIQNLFEVRERNRLGEVLFNRTNGKLAAKGEELFNLELKIPPSYQFVKEGENFLWARQPTPTTQRADISLIFYETEYKSEEQLFPENIIKLRDEILKTRVFGDPNNPESFVKTEKQVPPAFRNLKIDGQYAVEMRGQWKTNNVSMGGSFISYVTVNPDNSKLYFMEGFVFYPNEKHKSALWEIETILMGTNFIENPEK